MNTTVARLTAHTLLGRRRVALLLLLPLTLLALCLLARAFASADADVAAELQAGMAAGLLGGFGLGTLLPLLGLIAGTGAIGREIDDGSVVYLLSKPIRRSTIVVSKLAVAVGTVTGLGAVSLLLGGLILTGELGALSLAYAVAGVCAAVAYCAVFLLLAVVTRNAVVIGLLYALVWESVVGQFVPGAQALSIQQWALAVGQHVVADDPQRYGISSAVGPGTATALLVVVVLVSTWYAGQRLRSLRLTDEG